MADKKVKGQYRGRKSTRFLERGWCLYCNGEFTYWRTPKTRKKKYCSFEHSVKATKKKRVFLIPPNYYKYYEERNKIKERPEAH